MKFLTDNFRLLLGTLVVVALLVCFSSVEALSLKDATGGVVPGAVPGASLSNEDSPIGAVTTVAQLMQRFADGAAALAGAVAILFVVINAARMTFSLGDTEALSKAKKGLTWAAVGLVLIIFAYIVTKSVIALTYSGADGSSVIGTQMIEAPGNVTFVPVAGESNPDGVCKIVGELPEPCTDFHTEDEAIAAASAETIEGATEEAAAETAVPETVDDPEFALCQAEAELGLAGVCADLGVSDCTILNLQEGIDYDLLSTSTECQEPTGRYSYCTFRAIQELYQNNCVL